MKTKTDITDNYENAENAEKNKFRWNQFQIGGKSKKYIFRKCGNFTKTINKTLDPKTKKFFNLVIDGGVESPVVFVLYDPSSNPAVLSLKGEKRLL